MPIVNARKITEVDSLYDELKQASVLPGTDGSIGQLRADALARFKALGIPATTQEEWRFTNVSSLAAADYSMVTSPDSDASDILNHPNNEQLLKLTEALLVVVNGFYRPDLSRVSSLPSGVEIKSFAQGGLEDPVAQKYLGKIAVDNKHAFMALNSALFSDGLFIHVPANTVVADPIHVVFITTESGTPVMSHPRMLVVAEQSSEITLLETYLGPENNAYFSNSVVEVDLEDNAVVDHYRVNLEGKAAYHVATIDVRQSRSSHFSSEVVTFGSHLTRNDFGLILDGPGAFGLLNGLYQISGKQHVDNYTRIDHAHPSCDSHELYKGILDDQAKGVFNGSIFVRQIAQKTDSKQTNRTLLLSSDAQINTNPQLEIYADDVKCTHGATIGQLDADQLFYLQSRGIPADVARRILVFAFANEMVERIKFTPLRELLEAYLLESHKASQVLAKV